MKMSHLLLAALVATTTGLAGCGKEGTTPKQAAAPKKAADDGHGHGASKTAGETAEHAEEEGVLKLTEAEIEDAGIRTERAAEQTLRASIALAATIQPNRDRFAHVAPRIPGRILRVPAKAGDDVKAGQLLAELDSVELGEAHSAYLQAASQESLARADFQRIEGLFKEQVVPEKEFLRVRSELEKARAAARAAADKLRLMGVSAAGGGAQSTLPVVAPFAGTVIEKGAVIGELAQPDKPLFTIADLSTVWIEANVNERDLARLTKGASAEVTVQAYPAERFKGKLVYVSGMVDKESRTIRARIEVPNPGGKLKPEMFATAHLEAEARGKGFVVPTEAVVLANNKKVVFIKEVDGFEAREVEVGEELGGRQVLRIGLNAGEEVVVAGAYELKARLQKSRIGAGHAH